MEGIRFVVDNRKKVAVLIDLARHGQMWEDIYDHLLAKERADDKRLPYETVRRRLVRSGSFARSVNSRSASGREGDLSWQKKGFN
jgi:hypothetical protein